MPPFLICCQLHTVSLSVFLIRGPRPPGVSQKRPPSPWAPPAPKGHVKRIINLTSDTPGLWERRKIYKNPLPQVSGLPTLGLLPYSLSLHVPSPAEAQLPSCRLHQKEKMLTTSPHGTCRCWRWVGEKYINPLPRLLALALAPSLNHIGIISNHFFQLFFRYMCKGVS